MPARPFETRFLGLERKKFHEKIKAAMREEGERICQLRERAGLSQREVARAMALSANYLCELEKGRRAMNPALAIRHAQALKALAQ